MYSPDVVLRSGFLNLVQVTDLKTGGHFAALEVPDVLADDIWKFVEKLSNQDMKKNQNEKKIEN